MSRSVSGGSKKVSLNYQEWVRSLVFWQRKVVAGPPGSPPFEISLEDPVRLEKLRGVKRND